MRIRKITRHEFEETRDGKLKKRGRKNSLSPEEWKRLKQLLTFGLFWKDVEQTEVLISKGAQRMVQTN